MCPNNDYCRRNILRTLPFRRHRLNKEDSIELIFCAAVLLLYVSNRWFGAWDSILPKWFLKNHFGDVCGGMLFPAYANLLLSAVGAKFRVDGFLSTVAIGVLCSVAWEIIAPMIFAFSTADPLDAVAYIFGAVVHFAFRKLVLATLL